MNAPRNLFSHAIFKYLIGAALIWGALSVVLCFFHGRGTFFVEAAWSLAVCALCTLGLIALGKLLAGVFYIVTSTSQNRLTYLVQTSVWVMIKLACFLILNVILIKSDAVPRFALLLGLGTLGVVPLLGGVCWSRIDRASERSSAKEFLHA
jgi:hypothetical protein